MIRIREAIVVEGRYDKSKLSNLVDAPILETSGFGIFNNKEQMGLLRKAAQTRGLIVLTDSDGAGLVIRNHIKSAIPGKYLKHAFIPDVPGKEKRKRIAGKEGLLGVEGMTAEVIINALLAAGATVEGEEAVKPHSITKQDMMELGLSGGQGSSEKRMKLQAFLGLPKNLSANTLLQALNLLYTLEELEVTLEAMEKNNG